MQIKHIKAALGIFLVVLIYAHVMVTKYGCGGVKYMNIGGQETRIMETCSNAQRMKGLSDISYDDFTYDAAGMIFRFDTLEERKFWMKDMQFDLDMLWIRDGKIVKIDSQVPAPKPGEDPAIRSSSPFVVDTVLEFPAGYAAANGLHEGSLILPAR